MIDIENEVYSFVESALRSEYPDMFVTGEYVAYPAVFPCASIVESINSVYRASSTTDEVENHGLITYEVNVYSNKSKGKKSECKKIIGIIDSRMLSLGFVRRFMQPVPNIQDATIYRMFGRYQAVVNKDKTIFRR